MKLCHDAVPPTLYAFEICFPAILHEIVAVLWWHGMKSSAHIKFTKLHSAPFINFNYWQLVMLIFLPPCNGGLSLHIVTYESNSHTGGTAVTSSGYTPSLQICANLCTEQTDRDETTCFSYSYSASHQMCYLSSDLSLNVGETTYTIKGK